MPKDPNVDPFEAEITIGSRRRGLPRHVHPHQTDAFEIIEGTLDVWLYGSWRRARPSERVCVPPGAVHTVRNRGAEPVRFLNSHEPALHFPDHLEHLYRLFGEGRRRGALNPITLLDLALLVDSFPEDVRPAGRLGRAVLRTLAGLARHLDRTVFQP
ncbi:MAG: cupin domain-containing protein [Actinomycetota bacterium]|nr:cupin domain-containing protein [Actinomycetota bacterium]